MEPLSIATGIVTLIDATSKVILICQNYKAEVKGADWELPQIMEEVESLRAALQGLARLADSDAAAVSQIPQLSRLCNPKTGTFALCLSELQALERRLIPPGWTGESESKLRKLIHVTGWPLKKSFVEKSLSRLERYKARLNLDLGINTVENILSLKNTANAIKEEIVREGHGKNDFKKSFDLMKFDDHTEKLLGWLSVLDPSVKYNKSIRDRNAKTGKWLMEYEAFSRWKQTPASLLWLFGIPGCGKTILSSTVIKHLLDCRDGDGTLMVAYFYIDFSKEETQIPENMIRSLLKQIRCRSKSAAQELDLLYSDCANGTQQPSMDQLLSALYRVLDGIDERNNFFIIDALDECKERQELLEMLNRIYERKHPKLHILVTSRQELDIEKSLKTMTNDKTRICIQSKLVQEDIFTYIQDRLGSDKSLERFKVRPEIHEEIKKALMDKANGMFRYVACQLDSFRHCLNLTKLREALESLPKTLDGTYERILCGINETHRDYARKVLYWLTYSARTLSLVEVAEIVAMDPRGEPRFNAENRLLDSEEILETCSSLVSVFTAYRPERHDKVRYITLAHFSVKEYLISDGIRDGPANTYAISRGLANTSIAESCLALLLHFDKRDSVASHTEGRYARRTSMRIDSVDSSDVRFERKFPLAQYAAENWIEHVHNAGWDNNFIGGLVSELFLKRDTLENWIRIRDSRKKWMLAPGLSRPSRDIASPIFYASQEGLLKPLKVLIESGTHVNARGKSLDDALQAASYRGHKEIITLLLDAGADVNAGEGTSGTALQAASSQGHQEIMQILVDAGADLNAQDGLSRSALQAASYFGDQQVVRILLVAGADVNAHDGANVNALQVASYRGHQQIVKMLLDAGADVNAQGGEYGTALQAASSYGSEYGIALQAASSYGGEDRSTLPPVFPRGGNQQIVEILLNAGADANAQGGEYESPLQAALRVGRQDIARILRDHGAREDVKSMENDQNNEERDGL